MLARIFERPAVERASPNVAWPGGSWRSFISYLASHSGSVDQTLKNSASWACIGVLADAVSRTPFDAVRYRGDIHVPVEPQPALLQRPSGIVQKDVWFYQLVWSMLTDGNAFGQIVGSNEFGKPTQVEILDPAQVQDRKVEEGVASVLLVGEQGRHKLYPHGDVWHVPGLMVPGGTPFALSPIRYAANIVGISLKAEQFSHDFFEAGGHPSSVVYAARELTSEQAQAIKDSLVRATTGREPAVLGADLKRETTQVPPGETQFIELMRFCVEQVCRVWRVPPSMVYAASSGQNVTYANVTQADLHFLKHSLEGYYVRIENALYDMVPGPQRVRANRNAILRSDVAARYAAYEIGLRNRFVTVNEVRRYEDEAPFGPEFDTPGIPPFPAPQTFD